MMICENEQRKIRTLAQVVLVRQILGETVSWDQILRVLRRADAALGMKGGSHSQAG
ncbi:hypothetical protein [Sulfobacillus harzensis]|uniref:Uncharacterized protein n=1 Tax=Sulfobacillus harzensis TaxID=2729629 RepID=A0A7Y0L7Y3_9FIRM|nr:hypothetical protein [Sulfobacillus harzensis]NMP24090.1 hypothetical protein [Sulfobacillus harzensis]